MKPIELDLMLNYRYLSDLNAYRDKLLFIDTIADEKNNDYTQRLHLFDPLNKEDSIILEDTMIRYALIDDKIMILKASGMMETDIYDLFDKTKRGFHLPLAVNSIVSLNEDYYFIEAEVDLKAIDYHTFDNDKKGEYYKFLEDEEDYLVLDEYPFFFNGAGFINKKRNNGFLVHKKDHSIKRITPSTMEIEDVAIGKDKIYFLANDYQSMKGIFSKIYVYDASKDRLEILYDNKDMFINKIVMIHDKPYAFASKKTCISGKSIYEVRKGALVCVYESEYMFYNSVLSDCRFGKFKNHVTANDDLYIINTVCNRSRIECFDGRSLVSVTDFEGSVDDLAFMDDKLYVIALKDLHLQEIYQVADHVVKLTDLNAGVLDDRYVAKLEKIDCFNLDTIYGWVLKPYDFDKNKTYPAILNIHGGPKNVYGEVFYHEMQYWASHGYFVIFANPHCSDGRGDEFSDFLKHYGTTDYDDLMAVVDEALKRYPNIDAKRLGVTGGSYGGYMTNWIIAHTDRFKCAASQRSISNRVSDLYYSDYSYDSTYENGIPLDEKAIELFWDRSPLKYADNITTPTLFLQSTEDYRCPFPEAIQLFSALKWKGVDTRLVGFKGENHELSRSGKPKHRLRRIKEITDWMDKYLK